MKHYIYITHKGSINWIEKMPEKRTIGGKTYDGIDDPGTYEQAIKRAKERSIPSLHN